MSRFALRNPYFIVVVALIATVVGLLSVVRMPVDLFPSINIPVVVVATFYNGMPPEEIETEITGRFERFFTQASGINHIESRSLPGVSIIKVYFQPGTDADADVNSISNLALADLRRLPPGTLPPIVEKFDASSLPVCLITLQGEGLTETQLRDVGQFQIRTQVGVVPGASVAPPPFGGKYRQIMLYVDPGKLLSYNLSPMDVVRAVGNANLILPAGDVKLGPFDYNIYTNSQFHDISSIDRLPLKTTALATITIGDVGHAEDGHQIQTNLVRVNGQPSVYIPILKQGGDTNTIAVVDGVRDAVTHLVDIPKNLTANVVFDQSLFVKGAVETLIREGGIGLVLTAAMVLIFLGSLRATVAVLLSIPLSALTALIALYFGGSSINSMILAGLALVFSRLIDNAVIVLENIFRHLELGESPAVAAEKGGEEVSLAVLAATLTSAVVFFPVTFLYGVSRFLFSALALAVVLALFASYVVAMTVVPLFCARYIHGSAHKEGADGSLVPARGWGGRFNAAFGRHFHALNVWYERSVHRALESPRLVAGFVVALCLASGLLWPLVGEAFFPRTDAGQFVINLKAPSGTRLERTSEAVARVEQIIRDTIPPADLKLVVSNIGVVPDYSSIYTANAGPHTATVQVALNAGAHESSFEYMARVRTALAQKTPELTTYFQTGGIVDAVLNQGLPAPIDVQVSGSNLAKAFGVASTLASQIRALPGVSDVYIPQDIDYPSLQLDIDRIRASELGLNQREVVDNVITALTSNGMIAPNFWVDPKTGNDYLLTVQYPEQQIRTLSDLREIPLRSADAQAPALLDAVSHLTRFAAPTEVDHYQIQRVFDVYVNTATEDLGRVATDVRRLVAQASAAGSSVVLRGMVQGMSDSFRSFGLGLILSLVLLYLILVAQFRSFVDPLLILLAVPTGVLGVIVTLVLTGTTLNVMSLMGIIMMVGIVVSNSILIVEFAHRLEEDGLAVREAIITSCRVRLRPILMTSLATIIGLAPMALKLGTGSEQYAPLARAIIGGLLASVVLSLYLVPAVYLLLYRRRAPAPASGPTEPTLPRQEVD
jgi:HAE1 family hydrophobic/amphiphilic exporter-1